MTSLSLAVARVVDGDEALTARQQGAGQDAGQDGAEVAAFYRDARASLSPLIVHALELPQALSSLAFPEVAGTAPTGTAPMGDLVKAARQWAEDFATARDLVGRLPVPTDAAGQARGLYESAAMLNVEAARVLAVAAASSDPAVKQGAARAGYRYFTVAERLFDSGFRLLNQHQKLREGKLYFPAAVPNFRAAGLDADHPARTPGPQAQLEAQSETVAAGQWFASTNEALTQGREAFAATAESYRSAAPSRPGTARALTALAEELGGSAPASEASREASVAIRLSLVVLGESLRPQAGNPAAAQAAGRLRMIAERLWNSGVATVTDEVSAASRAVLEIAPAPVDHAALRRGGSFNGSPPALAPGQDPATGVPGGLPHLDPARILPGRG